MIHVQENGEVKKCMFMEDYRMVCVSTEQTTEL